MLKRMWLAWKIAVHGIEVTWRDRNGIVIFDAIFYSPNQIDRVSNGPTGSVEWTILKEQ